MNEEELFDEWNLQKKEINFKASSRFYREKEVWWCRLGKNIGSEQDGKGNFYERPVLIIKSFSRSVCLVIPLTTSSKKNPYHADLGKIDGQRSWAIISQVRLIDVKRLVNRITILDQFIFDEIRKAVRNLF